MSTRIPLIYGPKVLELFRNPKNMGAMPDADVVEVAGSPACGDMIKIYLKIVEKNGVDYVEKISFESFGCAANIAAASILTEMVKGKAVKDAWSISWKQVSDELGGLPVIKYHCSILAVGALKRAIRAYYSKKGVKPDWLPSELSVDEKAVMEEEEMIKKFYKFVSTPGGSFEQRKD
ncbi:MAG: iron-sulfur cluster assembly scaffold protein [Desulfurococcaceae archaeon]|uniref:Iron-sulfur cluster assembly scaffold protein n=1 Tax=Staphylothermus marinus TaxID=2280 RepID=A0A7C4D977_STAMA